MYQRDYRDVIGGGILTILGLAVAAYSLARFEMGTISQMGPGMFPTCLGFILAGLGAIIALPALFRQGDAIVIEWRKVLFVLAGVLAFALTVLPFGLVPAIMLLTIGSGLADRSQRPRALVSMAIILAGLAYLIFHVGLGITVAPFKWPF